MVFALLPLRIAEALEGDGHLDRPAIVDENAARLPEGIPRRVASGEEAGQAAAETAAPAAGGPRPAPPRRCREPMS